MTVMEYLKRCEVRWFAPREPPAHILAQWERIEAPVGQLCALCEKPIKADDQGISVTCFDGAQPIHLSCIAPIILAERVTEAAERAARN